MAETLRPIGRKLLVRKCTQGSKVRDLEREWCEIKGITIPAQSMEDSAFAEVLDVSDDCKYFRRDSAVGNFVKLPPFSPNHIHKVPGTEADFIVFERLFEEEEELAASQHRLNVAPLAVFGG